MSSDTWEAVQQVFDERATTNVRVKPWFFPFSGLVKCGHCGCSLVAQMAKGKYIYYRCSGFRGKCPERFLRQEALEDRFLDLLRKLRCDTQELGKMRCELEQACLGEGTDVGGSASLPRRDPPPGTPGALVRDGLALLDMGRTAHLRLASLPAEMKQQVLSLIFLRCSWANEELIGWFKSAVRCPCGAGSGKFCRQQRAVVDPEAFRRPLSANA